MLSKIQLKQARIKFREDCLKRDSYRCAICGKKNNLNVHHITDRTEIANGGYVKENGITLCDDGINGCHYRAEKFHITGGKEWVEGMSPNDLYKIVNSSKELAVKEAEKLDLRV